MMSKGLMGSVRLDGFQPVPEVSALSPFRKYDNFSSMPAQRGVGWTTKTR
jgi:hypothetical protein